MTVTPQDRAPARRTFVLRDPGPRLIDYIAIDAEEHKPLIRFRSTSLEQAIKEFSRDHVPSCEVVVLNHGSGCRSLKWTDDGAQHHVFILPKPEGDLR